MHIHGGAPPEGSSPWPSANAVHFVRVGPLVDVQHGGGRESPLTAKAPVRQRIPEKRFPDAWYTLPVWVRWLTCSTGVHEGAHSRRRPPYVKQSPTKGFLTVGTLYPCVAASGGDPCTTRASNVEA